MRAGRSILIAGLALCGAAAAQTVQQPTLKVTGDDVERRVNGILALMGFQVIPDITTMSLSIQQPTTGNPDLLLGQIGAGFTWSDDLPLYLEGVLGYSRYDPDFLVSDGVDTYDLPVQWNSVSATAGIGWDIRLADRLVLRPIASATIGYIASDAKVLGFLLSEKRGLDVDFLAHGGLNAWGYGGALVLDYADYTPEREIDIELRYSQLHLQTYGDRSSQTAVDVGNVNLWARWRAPIGNWTAFERPVRYALELTYSEFLHDQRGLLGFNRLTSLGAGIEFDLGTSGLVERARWMGRYVFGDDTTGFSVGFAVTF